MTLRLNDHGSYFCRLSSQRRELLATCGKDEAPERIPHVTSFEHCLLSHWRTSNDIRWLAPVFLPSRAAREKLRKTKHPSRGQSVYLSAWEPVDAHSSGMQTAERILLSEETLKPSLRSESIWKGNPGIAWRMNFSSLSFFPWIPTKSTRLNYNWYLWCAVPFELNVNGTPYPAGVASRVAAGVK